MILEDYAAKGSMQGEWICEWTQSNVDLYIYTCTSTGFGKRRRRHAHALGLADEEDVLEDTGSSFSLEHRDMRGDG